MREIIIYVTTLKKLSSNIIETNGRSLMLLRIKDFLEMERRSFSLILFIQSELRIFPVTYGQPRLSVAKRENPFWAALNPRDVYRLPTGWSRGVASFIVRG